MNNIKNTYKYAVNLPFVGRCLCLGLLGLLLLTLNIQTTNAQCDPNTCKQICQGSLASFTIQAIPRPNTAGYGLIYFLTDASGVVIEATADLGGLTAPTSYTFATFLNTPGTYFIHALSYNLSDPPVPIPTTGANISTVGSTSPGCHEWGENDNNIAELCLVVNPTPPIVTHTLTACETNYGMGTASFTLTDADAAFNGGGVYTVSYHQTRIDALNNTNALTSPYTSGSTTLYARVSTSSVPPCTSISTLNLSVTPKPNAAFTVASFCAPGPSAAAIISGVLGGTFSVDNGATIDATGVITGATPGTTYTVTYSVTVGACTNSSTASAMAYDCTCAPVSKCKPAPLCATDGAFAPPAGYAQLFVLTNASGVILSVNTTGTFSSEFLPAAPSTYTINTLVYNTSNPPVPLPVVGANISSVGSTTKGCYNDNFLAEKVCYTLNPPPPPPTMPTNNQYCDGSPVVPISVADPGAGFMIDWYTAATGGSAVTGTTTLNGSSITLSGGTPALPPVGESVTVYAEVRNTTTGCVSATRTPVTLTNLALDEVSFVLPQFCAEGASQAAVISGVEGGTFSFDPAPGDGAIINATTGQITNAVGGTTYSVKYTVDAPEATCPNSATVLVAAISCPCTQEFNVCEGSQTCINTTGQAGTGYNLRYYITGPTGTVLQIIDRTNATAPFDLNSLGLSPADGYNLYILSYNTSSVPNPLPAVGQVFTTIGSVSPGCYNADLLSDYFCINVKAVPFAAPDSADICLGATTTLIGNTNSADTFEWEVIDAGTTGVPLGVLASTEDLTFNSTGFAEGTLTLQYTITNSAADPPCPAVYTTTIKINNPLVNPIGTSICEGATSPVNIAGNGTGGIDLPAEDQTHLWTLTDPGTTGASSGILSNTTTGTVTVNPTGLAPGTMVVTYTYTDVSSGCFGTDTARLTIRPKPIPSLTPTTTTVCQSAIADVTFVGLPAAMLPATGTYSIMPATAAFNTTTGVFDPNTAAAGTYTVTYTYNDGFANSCVVSATATITVVANPIPTITDPADVCVNGAALTFTGSPNVPTPGSFTTTAPAASLTDNANGTATLNPATAGAGTYTVTYTFTDAAGCVGTAATSVTIFPTADAAFTIADFCYPGPGPAAVPTTLSGTHEYALISPLGDGAYVNETNGELNDGISNTTYTVQHTITTADGCITTATDLVKVNQLPTISLTDPIDECYNSSFDMIFVAEIEGDADPANGSFSITPATAAFTPNNAAGTAVLDPNTALDPNTVGITYTVTYSYTDALTGCSSSVSQQVYVIPAMSATFTMAAFCIAANGDDGPANPATITGVTGGTFSFAERPTDLTTTIDPATGQIFNANIGVTYQVQYNAPNGCDFTVVSVVCSSCCNPNAGDQSGTPPIANICPNNDGTTATETVSVQVTFGGAPPATGYVYTWYVTDANGIIKQIITPSPTYDSTTPIDFTASLTLNAGLTAGTYCIRGFNYNPLDTDLSTNGGTVTLPSVGQDIDTFISNLTENDGVATAAGTLCGDINITDCTPFTVNNVRCTDIAPWDGN